MRSMMMRIIQLDDYDGEDSKVKIQIVVNFCFVFQTELLLAWLASHPKL